MITLRNLDTLANQSGGGGLGLLYIRLLLAFQVVRFY
jgi:hypothetical protein